MPDREVKIAAIKTHCRALTELDKDGWLQIYADNVVFEDPARVDIFRGIEALRTTFWELVELTAPMRLGLLEEVIVCGDEAIAILSADSSWGGETRRVGPLVDHFTFGPDGKITTMRSYWHFAKHGYRPELATDALIQERMIAAVKTHIRGESEGDKQAWANIFADDVLIEDPVGSGAIYRGIDVVGTTFWDQAQRAGAKLELLEDVIVCGDEAVAIVKAEVGPPDGRRTLSPIVDHFTFDEAGKVTRMRAFFAY